MKMGSDWPVLAIMRSLGMSAAQFDQLEAAKFDQA
jgi:hypothetical protein